MVDQVAIRELEADEVEMISGGYKLIRVKGVPIVVGGFDDPDNKTIDPNDDIW